MTRAKGCVRLEAEAEEVGQADQPVLDRVVISRRAFLPSDLRPSPAS